MKYNSTGEVERYKARLVAKRYSLLERLDYKETFSLVANMITVRSVVASAAASGWYIFQIGIHNVFIQGDLLEEVFIHITYGFSSQMEFK